MKSSAPWWTWARGQAFPGGRPHRRALAGLHLRHLPLLPQGPGEPVRQPRSSPATPWTAAMPNTPWPTSATAFPCRRLIATPRPRRCLCAGLIGYRSYRLAGDGGGAPGDLRLRGRGPHHHPGGGAPGQKGLWLHPPGGHRDPGVRPAAWGRSGPATPSELPPEELDAAIIFAPVGALVPAALGPRPKAGWWSAAAST